MYGFGSAEVTGAAKVDGVVEGRSLLGYWSVLYWSKSLFCYSINYLVYLETGWKDRGCCSGALGTELSSGFPSFIAATPDVTELT